MSGSRKGGITKDYIDIQHPSHVPTKHVILPICLIHPFYLQTFICGFVQLSLMVDWLMVFGNSGIYFVLRNICLTVGWLIASGLRVYSVRALGICDFCPVLSENLSAV